jgi:hypothetical protein
MLNLQITTVKMWTFKLRMLKIQSPEVSHVAVWEERIFLILAIISGVFKQVSYLTL